jgi:hypothetical protein
MCSTYLDSELPPFVKIWTVPHKLFLSYVGLQVAVLTYVYFDIASISHDHLHLFLGRSNIVITKYDVFSEETA